MAASKRSLAITRALREARRALEAGAKGVEIWTDTDKCLLVIRKPGDRPERKEFVVGMGKKKGPGK